jgi:hypothetical protein
MPHLYLRRNCPRAALELWAESMGGYASATVFVYQPPRHQNPEFTQTGHPFQIPAHSPIRNEKFRA